MPRRSKSFGDHEAGVATMLALAHRPDIHPFERLLVATDGGPGADSAIAVAKLLAARDSATVEVIAVLSPHVALHRLVHEQLRAAGVEWPTRVEIGQTATVIAERARAANADLIIVG